MTSVSSADALITCWDDKFARNFWRPYTAIRNATADGNPLTIQDDAWETLYLAPEARGRGLGRALFAYAVDDLLDRGFDPIVVWVFEAYAAARRFYEAASFRPDGTRQPVDFGEVSLPEIRYRLG